MRLALFALLCFAALGNGCFVVDEPDAGPRCPAEGEERGVLLGHTGRHFVLVQPGDTIPTWRRPQGGIGTHINIAMPGFSLGTPFQSLNIEGFGPEGAACEETEQCADGETCDRGSCRRYICSQVNVQWPTPECTDEGFLHINELPVRFRNDVPLEELDGLEGELRLTLTPRDGPAVEHSVPVKMEVGDFIEPSWWNN
jgi:hypothetical protein